MIQDVKKYQINIFNESYTIVSDEAEYTILKAASMVDSLMNEAKKSGSVDSKKIAVLVALQLAGKIINLEEEYKRLKEEEIKLIKKIDLEITNI